MYFVPFAGFLQFLTDGYYAVNDLLINGLSDRANSLVIPGGTGSITGEGLKYDPENDAEGIWFVPAGDGEAVRVDVLTSLTGGSLMFSIPSGLQAGNYTLVSSQALSYRPSLIFFSSDSFKKSLQNDAMRKFFALSEIK